MEPEFSLLGRGKAGRALAEAWGPRARLVASTANPAGLVVLAVPDGQLAAAAARFPGRCVHLSGSLDLPGVPCLHPLTSFDGRARDWRGTPLAVTGAAPEVLIEAFSALGFRPFPLPAERKALYHAAAVLACGHAATLWLGAEGLLKAAGIVLPGEGLFPLIRRTAENVQAGGDKGRTGPFVRHDEATIQRDANALPPAWREIFLKLGRM